MTTLLDHRPDASPLVEGVREINAWLDRMHLVIETQGPGVGLVADLERIGRRVEALKLKVVARSETAAAAEGAGFTSTAAWLARQTRQTRDAAAREARLAADLATAPGTGDALADGALSAAHAAVITETLAKLPAGVTAGQRAIVEADLVAKAARFDPSQLRRVARRALEAIEPDETVVDAHEDEQVRDAEQHAWERSRFTFHVNDDETVSGHFTVPELEFSFLRKILEAMTAPRNHRSRESRSSQHDHRGPDRDAWAARRGQAFAELLRHLPTDHLHSKTSATVVVHLREDVLRGALAVAGLDTGQRISAGEARRLACTAGILPAVLGARSLPLDLGVTQRLFTEAQRIALSLAHTTCAADGCGRPFSWCEIHHRRPWSRGGTTDLANAVPLCSYHHRRAHAP